MKFIHIADCHLDVPFTSLGIKPNLCEKRRLEQRAVFRKTIDYARNNKIEYIFIAGDLFEHSYIKKSTIDYINELFKQVPNTKIFITPGNHDPYIKDSFYDTYDFNDNVFIFRNSKIEKYEDSNLNIYGMAFTDFYMNGINLSNISIKANGKPNIFICHADLNGANDCEGLSYNPISEYQLELLGFDYCALGHIHKKGSFANNKIVYPGSTIALGFDEERTAWNDCW